jgi:hypothetical protein
MQSHLNIRIPHIHNLSSSKFKLQKFNFCYEQIILQSSTILLLFLGLSRNQIEK